MSAYEKEQKFPIWYQSYQRLSKPTSKNPVFMRICGLRLCVRFPLSALFFLPKNPVKSTVWAYSQFSQKPFWYQPWYQRIWTRFITIFILSARYHRKFRYCTNNFRFSVNTSSVSVVMVFSAVNIRMPHLTYDKSLVYVVVK